MNLEYIPDISYSCEKNASVADPGLFYKYSIFNTGYDRHYVVLLPHAIYSKSRLKN